MYVNIHLHLRYITSQRFHCFFRKFMVGLLLFVNYRSRSRPRLHQQLVTLSDYTVRFIFITEYHPYKLADTKLHMETLKLPLPRGLEARLNLEAKHQITRNKNLREYNLKHVASLTENSLSKLRDIRNCICVYIYIYISKIVFIESRPG